MSGVSCRQVPDRHLGLRRLSCGVPRVNGSTALFFQQSPGRFRHMTLVRLELLPACTAARARLVAGRFKHALLGVQTRIGIDPNQLTIATAELGARIPKAHHSACQGNWSKYPWIFPIRAESE